MKLVYYCYIRTCGERISRPEDRYWNVDLMMFNSTNVCGFFSFAIMWIFTNNLNATAGSGRWCFTIHYQALIDGG
jgi:hypothetical protein